MLPRRNAFAWLAAALVVGITLWAWPGARPAASSLGIEPGVAPPRPESMPAAVPAPEPAPVRRQLVESPAAAPDADQRAAADDEWLQLPRNQDDFVGACRSAPESLRAERLYRNHALNPDDACIEPGRRGELVTILGLYVDRLRAMRAALFDLRKQELEVLQRAGLATRLEQDRSSPSGQLSFQLPSTAAGEGFIAQAFRSESGDVEMYGATGSQLPRSHESLQTLHALGHELGARIIAWFRGTQALPPTPAGALAERLAQPR